LTRETSFLQLSSLRSQKKVIAEEVVQEDVQESVNRRNEVPSNLFTTAIVVVRERELCTRFSPLEEAEEPVIVVVKMELEKTQKAAAEDATTATTRRKRRRRLRRMCAGGTRYYATSVSSKSSSKALKKSSSEGLTRPRSPRISKFSPSKSMSIAAAAPISCCRGSSPSGT
jgi:UDP-N-acetylenolpyruvoylglucosamine reductase